MRLLIRPPDRCLRPGANAEKLSIFLPRTSGPGERRRVNLMFGTRACSCAGDHRPAFSWPLALLAGVVLFLSGCLGSSDPPDSSGPFSSAAALPSLGPTDETGAAGSVAVSDVPQIRSEHDMLIGRGFPLDAFSLTPTQSRLIDQAANLLASKCMAERGFVMPPYPTVTATAPAQNELVIRFGVGILSEVEEFGYDPPPQYFPSRPSPPPGDTDRPGVTNQSDPVYEAALLGRPEDRPSTPPIAYSDGSQFFTPAFTADSCVGRAYAGIGLKDAAAVQDIVSAGGSAEVGELSRESRNRTASDARVLQVIRDWSRCMAESGFTTPNPTDAANTYGPGAKNQSVAAATADVKCKYQTNYFGIQYAVTVAYQQELVDRDLALLESLADAHATILDKANAVIQAG